MINLFDVMNLASAMMGQLVPVMCVIVGIGIMLSIANLLTKFLGGKSDLAIDYDVRRVPEPLRETIARIDRCMYCGQESDGKTAHCQYCGGPLP